MGLPGLLSMLAGLAPTLGQYYKIPDGELGSLSKARAQVKS